MNQWQITQTRRGRKPNPLSLHSKPSRSRPRRHIEKRTGDLSRQRKSPGHVADFFADAIQCGFVGAILQRFSDEIGNLEHFFFLHPTGGDGRCADADTAGLERRAGIERNGVFVHRNAGAIENFLRFFSVEILRAKIDKHQMIVGSTGDDAITVFS